MLIRLGVAPDAGAARRAEGFAGRVRGQLDRAQQSANDLRRSIGGVVTSLVGLAALVQAGRGIVAFNTEMDTLESRLVTLTGSAEAAAEAMGMLERLTLRTPFQINDLTNAYASLLNMGIEPTEEALIRIGDVAASRGVEMQQYVEAVTDAVTGEFERLKEFGIRASSEGDRVRFTFRGVTTEVGKNADEISRYLDEVVAPNYAGAMARQMDTLGGAISNARSAVLFFARSVGRSGLNEAIMRFANALQESIDGTDSLASRLGSILGQAVDVATRALQWLAENGQMVKDVLLVLGSSLVMSAVLRFGQVLLGVVTSLLSPLGLLKAAIMFLPLIIEDIYRFMQGRPSVLGSLLGKDSGTVREWFREFFDWLKSAWEWIVDMAPYVWEGIKVVGRIMWDIVRGAGAMFVRIGEWLGDFAYQVTQNVQRAYREVVAVGELMGNAIGDAVWYAVKGLQAAWEWLKAAYGAAVDWMAEKIEDLVGAAGRVRDSVINTLAGLPFFGDVVTPVGTASAAESQAFFTREAQRNRINADLAANAGLGFGGGQASFATGPSVTRSISVVQNIYGANAADIAAEAARRIERSQRETERQAP